MKSSWTLSLLALLSSATCLAILVASSGSSAPDEATRRIVTTPSVGESATEAELLTRLDSLAKETGGLGDRVAALELRTASTRTLAGGAGGAELVTREEFDLFRDEVLELLGGNATSTNGAGTTRANLTHDELQDFRDHVATALQDIRKKEAAAKFRSIEEKESDLDHELPRIREWLRLTGDQTEDLRTALLAKYQRDADLLRRWQEGEEPEVIDEMKRTDRRVHRDELAEIFTPEQYQRYTARKDR